MTGAERPPQRGRVVISCEGLHSVIRKQLHPNEGEPLYSGVNMWRGVSVWGPILSGASMIRAGWLSHGKIVVYPIRNNVDGNGKQLVNWVVEFETPNYKKRDWNRPGRLEDFIGRFEDWHFDWLDVPALFRAADAVLEFPMIDQDPLPWWTQGRVPYKGTGGAVQDLLAGQISVMFLPVHVALPFVKEQKLNILSAGGTQRAQATPDVPSLAEAAGIRDIDVDIWYGLYAPAKTPKEIITKLNEGINALLKDASVRETLAKQGLQPTGGPREKLDQLTKTDLQRWSQVVSEARIEAE